MELNGFVKGSALAIGATALFPALAPLAVAGIVGGAGAVALTTPFRTPNVAPNAFQQREFQPVQPVQPAFQQTQNLQRPALVR